MAGMGKVGKALGMDLKLGGDPGGMDAEMPEMDEEMPASMPPESEAPEAGGQEAEVAAMRLFSKATTDEGKVAALKGFLQALGVLDY